MGGPGVGPALALGLARAAQQQAQQAAQAQGGGVGQRVVVGQVGLGQRQALEGGFVVQGGQHHGQVAHQRAVAGVARVVRAGQRAFEQEALDAAPAGVAAVHRPGLQPLHEGLADVAHERCVELRDEALQRVGAALQQGRAEGKAHGGVVGDLAACELEPAATHDLAVHAVAGLDLARAHELHRGAQRVADGQPEVGAEHFVEQLTHSGPPPRSRRRGR
ncbi:hypothetical protein D9M68_780530 [compost metagenome]